MAATRNAKDYRDFPQAIVQAEDEENEKIKSDFAGYFSGVVRVGPEGYFLPGIYEQYANDLYSFTLRDTDTFVVSYPKSGTTWMQEMVWLLLHNLDYEGAKVDLDARFPFIDGDVAVDYRIYDTLDTKEVCVEKGFADPGCHLETGKSQPSPRTLKTHLPFTLLPPDLLQKCKVIYTARDPRDVAISYFYHHAFIKSHGFTGDLALFLKYFLKEQVLWSPFWSHIREAWERRHHPNLLLVTYEQMKADLPDVLSQVAQFLGKAITSQEKDKLCKHLDISSMKANPAVNGELGVQIGLLDSSKGSFIRQGKSGGWQNTLSQAQAEEFSHWMNEKSGGLDREFGWHY